MLGYTFKQNTQNDAKYKWFIHIDKPLIILRVVEGLKTEN